MAPQTIAIEENAPNTLPADFAEWDGGAPPATLPATLPDDFFDEIDAPAAASAKVAKAQAVVTQAPAKVAKAQAVVTQAPAKAPGKTTAQKAKAAAPQAVAVPAPAPALPRPLSVEPAEKGKEKSKSPVKGIVIGTTLAVLVAAGIFVPLKLMKPSAGTAVANQPVSKQPVAGQPAVTSAQSAPSSALATPTPLTSQQEQATAAQTAQQQHSVDPGKMVDQLVAPSRLAHNISGVEKDSGPSQSFSASGMEGLGGASGVGSVLGGTAHPKVNLASTKSMNISSGVASGLLLQKRDPVYPTLAKQANVSGTVVLDATISKTGTIQNLHVLSGPIMLRQAAMDAVSAWRYKPYMLDGQPVDVQTTINLTFALGR